MQPTYPIEEQTQKRSVWAIIVAAGSGSRMGEAFPKPKQFLSWQGVPLYWHAVRALGRSPLLDGIVLVLPQNDTEKESKEAKERAKKEHLGLPLLYCEGGAQRRDSVRMGLAALPESCDYVLIHDGARPFVRTSLVTTVAKALLSGKNAVVPGIPVTDTIKVVADGNVCSTLDRASLCRIQTPQGFLRSLLVKAHEEDKNTNGTDDASLIEALGEPVFVLKGDETNRKITHPSDLAFLMQTPSDIMTIGQGYDVHRFGGTRPIILGGVPIPSPLMIAAHSDGDVLLHALMDALLGAACAGDIGQHFPDTDPRFAGISSSILLDRVRGILLEKQIEPIHLDATIIAERPKIAPYRAQIAANIARLLALPTHAVNIKATTEEGLGFTGRQEGIKAQAIVLCRTHNDITAF
ncbi:MAG: 2-C-methyl-D-erythritol 4-phosphate cytidylyltransferase [Desulfovibrio sp.]|nr:2-C-methyl-D-erythritol 4-phosphate cytidylyltransferase [Desulfovibrio sp.]